MGEIKKIVCCSCGRSWQCKTGCGINHAKLSSVLGYFKEELQKDIQQQTQGQLFTVFSFGFQPALCQSCQDIVTVPVLELGKERRKYIGACLKCQNEITEEQLNEKLVCPICQNSAFDVQREGSWD